MFSRRQLLAAASAIALTGTGLPRFAVAATETDRRFVFVIQRGAMDGLAAKGEAARDKIMGGKQQAQQLGEKRLEMREQVSSELLQEIFLK